MAISSLPPNVLAALQQGKKVEAIALLREAGGLGLKEAKDAIDQYLRESSTSSDNVSSATVSPLPANVVEALQRGNKMEAIRLLREETGLGLKEAKERVEAEPQSPRVNRGSGSPGEVVRSGGLILWGVALVVGVVVVYYFFRSG